MATKDDIEELTRAIAEADQSIKNAEQVLSTINKDLVGQRKKVETASATVSFCENALLWMRKNTDLVNMQQFKGLRNATLKHREALYVAQEQLTIAENRRYQFEASIPEIQAYKQHLEERLAREYGQVVPFQLRNQGVP